MMMLKKHSHSFLRKSWNLLSFVTMSQVSESSFGKEPFDLNWCQTSVKKQCPSTRYKIFLQVLQRKLHHAFHSKFFTISAYLAQQFSTNVMPPTGMLPEVCRCAMGLKLLKNYSGFCGSISRATVCSNELSTPSPILCWQSRDIVGRRTNNLLLLSVTLLTDPQNLEESPGSWK